MNEDLVRTIKLGFLPAYIAKEITWKDGVVVLKTKHPSTPNAQGPEIHIPAPTQKTFKEVVDSLSAGAWFSDAARWVADQYSQGYMVMQGTGGGVLFALAAEGHDTFTLENTRAFKDKASLAFIRIFTKYSHRV